MPTADTDYSLHNISTVAGRYVLDQTERKPGVNIFACRLRSISTSQFVVSAPVIARIGQRVMASFPPFGDLSGRASRHVSDGFAVDLQLDVDQRIALAHRMDIFRNRPWQGIADRRGEQRFMPSEPRSVIILEGGEVLPCLVVDFSASGAAVSADTQPVVGAPVTVGHVRGQIVRVFDVGFAVRFDTLQTADDIESLLEAPREWRQAVSVLEPIRIDTSEPGDTAEGYGYD